MFLTTAELEELTGRKRWSAQIRWLKEKHWAFTLRADGRPVVARQEAERQLVTGSSKASKAVAYEPNFAAGHRTAREPKKP